MLAYLDEIGLSRKPSAASSSPITTRPRRRPTGNVKLSAAEVWAHKDDAAVIEGTVPRAGIPPERIAAMLAAMPAEQRSAAGTHEADEGGRARGRRPAPRRW